MSYGTNDDQNIPTKRHAPEDIATTPPQVEVLVLQGPPVTNAIRQIGVTEVTN